MDSAFSTILSTPQSTLLTIAGILFLLLAVAGSVVGKINVPPERQKWAGIIGGFLLLGGILIPAAKPETLQGTLISGNVPTVELKSDIEHLQRLIKESVHKEMVINKGAESGETDSDVEAELEKQRAMTEKLKASQRETERILKERIAVSELKHGIMQYYNKKSQWAKTFVMERIDRLVIKGSDAHVRYRYSPIQGNSQKRSDIGYDERIFKLNKEGGKYKVVSMGGHMSARF
ncbi:MAG: hypothetical protein KUG71_03650 [Porticoccaceae bacterium]|nr:hypothetical protein [Porticoccaceae bacterium]